MDDAPHVVRAQGDLGSCHARGPFRHSQQNKVVMIDGVVLVPINPRSEIGNETDQGAIETKHRPSEVVQLAVYSKHTEHSNSIFKHRE